MDANGTRFHLLLGKDDWSSCTDTSDIHRPVILGDAWKADDISALAWDAERMELTLQPLLLPVPAQGTLYQPEQRRGSARDRYGNWYWIDQTKQELLVSPVGTGTTTHFWSAADGLQRIPTPTPGSFQPMQSKPSPSALQLGGLTVTTDHYLVVGVIDPAGLLIFDLYAGGSPRQVYWPEGVPFVPFDMAPHPCGGVWILDRVAKQYWALDRLFYVMTQGQANSSPSSQPHGIFQPQDGSSSNTASHPIPSVLKITNSDALPLTAHDPIALEALPDGTVLIIDSNPGHSFSLIYRYHFAQQLGNPVSTEAMKDLIEKDKQPLFHLRGYDFAFVPEHTNPSDRTPVSDRLYIVSEEGNQSYAFTLSLQGEQLIMQPHREYLPMRLFAGKGLVAAETQPYYDLTDRWIPLIEQPRPLYALNATLHTPPSSLSISGAISGATLSSNLRPAFDGRTPDCVWHRLMLDACIPLGAQVQVWSRTADDQAGLATKGWQQEPPLYKRSDGSELPFVNQSSSGYDTWELLLQQARGRYLQIQLRLSGNRRTTPHIRALRIYYPRFSYLEHYLPAIYREDKSSASFLERFLANIEGFFTTIEDKIANVQLLFTVASTPPETLEWLANWFGVALDPSWGEVKQRLFLKHAMDFFRYRGTIRGLRMALRLALEDCPDETIFTDTTEQRLQQVRIVEKYRTRYAPGVVFGDPSELAGPRLVMPMQRWNPQQGRATLLLRYADFLQQLLQQSRRVAEFPLNAQDAWQQFAQEVLGIDPSTVTSQTQDWQSRVQSAWQQFTYDTLGFVPTALPGNQVYEQRWQQFLLHRYGSVSNLNTAYSSNVSDFAQVALFAVLPSDGAPLLDWYQFEAIVLTMYNTAHRFTVLLPSVDLETIAEQQRRQDLVQRIIDLEKPAHTTFEVKFYWAFFRVGEARLGEDTLLDQGSRVPQLMTPMTLGQAYLSESYIASGHPQDRTILGRDVLNE